MQTGWKMRAEHHSPAAPLCSCQQSVWDGIRCARGATRGAVVTEAIQHLSFDSQVVVKVCLDTSEDGPGSRYSEAGSARLCLPLRCLPHFSAAGAEHGL
ncbi:unnamed protein product [Pleuronectes platessa]|uniref:Uncharacterized protein n=1 Tax=Pleuronectes platessa TaxID=8262 RepID=A0A9N7TVQ5_PLEPL|nr:unnamed protein product [Pleuronectes platessa]